MNTLTSPRIRRAIRIGTPLRDQPYWDLVALLDLLLDIGDSTGPGDIDPDDLCRFENYAKTALTNRA